VTGPWCCQPTVSNRADSTTTIEETTYLSRINTPLPS
jgi:hypothetical protein